MLRADAPLGRPGLQGASAMRVAEAGLRRNGGLTREIGASHGNAPPPVVPLDQGANEQKHAPQNEDRQSFQHQPIMVRHG
jgi:hypothetical protein